MKNNNGFTLIEIIVVLLILSILSAIAVPSLTGFIGDAQKRTIISECRSCVLASSTIAAERHGVGDIVNNDNCMESDFVNKVLAYAETPASGIIDKMKFSNSSLTELYYTRDNTTVKYANKKYTFVDGIDPDDTSTGGKDPVIIIPDIPDPGGSDSGNTQTDPEFVNLRDFKGDEDAKETAIISNGLAVIDVFNVCFKAELKELSPHLEVKYWNKAECSISGTFTSCDLYNTPPNVIPDLKAVTIDIVPEINAVLAKYNIGIGYTKLFFETQTVNGKTVRSLSPYKIKFKSMELTGSTSIYYIYDLTTGELSTSLS